jgi:parallel beta-helix repeat protein
VGTNPLNGNNIAFQGVTNNAIIEKNSLSGAELGLLFDVPSSNNIVRNNTVVGNVKLIGTAIYTVDGSTNFQILGNKVSYERDGIAIQQIHNGTASSFIVSGNTCTNNMNAMWMAVDNSTISHNILTNNKEGVDITGTGNIIESNIITNNTVVGIALTTKNSTDSNTVSNNILSSNGGNYYKGGPGTVGGA